MRIAYYMPFKPLGHANPSGDLTMGTGLHAHLRSRGHDIRLISRMRTRWLYLHPWLWPEAAASIALALAEARRFAPDIWLTYHAYYKAPDLLGPLCAAALDIPYVIYQGTYATKHRRRILRRPGFHLNRRSLLAADLVVCNKKRDYHNCSRLLPEEKLLYNRPGLRPGMFRFSHSAREALRSELSPDNAPLVVSTAMLRNDVKSQGMRWMFKALSRLAANGTEFQLAVVGDGPMRNELERLGRRLFRGRCRFLGHIARNRLHSLYSAADIFAFPGINESFGMAYLEAQACGLPVVAFDGWGVPEAVSHGKTGLLAPPFDREAFNTHLKTLVDSPELRRDMGQQAAKHVRTLHNSEQNLDDFTTHLLRLHTRRTLQRSAHGR
jgi:glycosyltransferase involved in cell wall biosynthesis